MGLLRDVDDTEYIGMFVSVLGDDGEIVSIAEYSLLENSDEP